MDNPKDAIGSNKVPMSAVPSPVLMEVALAMLEGSLKYGRHNYRAAPVRASIYYDALLRHAMAWYEGEDIDPKSGLSHLVKAIASLIVLRDAQFQGMLVDDRPPETPPGWIEHCNEIAASLIRECKNPVDPIIARPCFYPDCDGGPSTGYCSSTCRIRIDSRGGISDKPIDPGGDGAPGD